MSNSFSSLFCLHDDVNLIELTVDVETFLLSDDHFDTETFCKKILDLFNLCRKMKENMTVSETHESNPWNVVECAISGTSGFTKVPVYYVFGGARQTAIKIASFNHFVIIHEKRHNKSIKRR
jgi:hypothetical protein